MARVAFPSYDVQTLDGKAGGVGAFIVYFARQLRERGDDVTIIAITGGTKTVSVDAEWLKRYRAWGIDVVHVHNEEQADRWPNIWTVTLSERLTPLLRDFDVVYFSDWGNVAFNTVRMKRLGATGLPICITVLHGASSWLRMLDGGALAIPDHIYLDFVERYSARYSDYVIAPSRRIAQWTQDQGWETQHKPEILGLPFLPQTRQTGATGADAIKRVVFFGRLDRRKGIDLFVSAILLLHRETPEIVSQLDEVVLLGYEVIPGKANEIRQTLSSTGLSIIHVADLDSGQAQNYLAANAVDVLAVVPSPFENLPYAVIESSLIPGLNIICTRGGGTPEIFAGLGEAQLFDPSPSSLAAKIRERMICPLTTGQLVQYDYASHNLRWLEFHDRVTNAIQKPTTSRVKSNSTTVDVCVAFFNKGRYFSQLLESLELQTFTNFRVIAVDDGSTDPSSIAVFDAMAEKYAARRWLFFRQDNQFVDAARNRAAERSQAEYILFVDADDVLSAHAIERFVETARYSSDDCLTSGIVRFTGDHFPYDRRTGRNTTPILEVNMPLGPTLASAVIEPSVLGGSPIFMRRQAFLAVGGFRELRGAAHEDWELKIKLIAAGFQTDVIPEYLYYYRQSPDSLSRNVDRRLARSRLIQQFDRQLALVGLPDAASIVSSNLGIIRERENQAYWLGHQLKLSQERFNAFGLEVLDVPVASSQLTSTISRPIFRLPPKNVLVVIPTLNIGGAEMDLLRNLPRIDREKFRVTVFTFLSRGSLASELSAAGIEVVGPLIAIRFMSSSDIKRIVRASLRRLRLQASRLKSRFMVAAARNAPEFVGRLWKSLKHWLRLKRSPRRRWVMYFRIALRNLRTAARAFVVVIRSALSELSSNVGRFCRRLLGFLPAPLRKLFHETVTWLVYTTVGIGLAPFIRLRKVDLVHTVLPNAYVVGSIASFWGDRPLIMSRVGLNWHQQTEALFRFVERRLCHPNVTAAVANCEAIRQELRIEGIAAEKLHLIENGIDVADFTWRMTDRDGVRGSLGLRRNVIVMTVVANLHVYKGHADLLRALNFVGDIMPDWILLAVGSDVDGNRAKLEKMSAAFGLSGRVRFFGPRSDIPAILSAADIHVSSSHTEGFPNNLLEAMCARLPIVATDVGGVREIIVDQQSGVLVPAQDHISLGRAILELALDETERHRLGENARQRVSQNFTIDRSVKSFERLYSGAMHHSQDAHIDAVPVLAKQISTIDSQVP